MKTCKPINTAEAKAFRRERARLSLFERLVQEGLRKGLYDSEARIYAASTLFEVDLADQEILSRRRSRQREKRS